MGTSPLCCDTFNQTDNCPSDCHLRMVFSVQQFSSPVRDVVLRSRPPLYSDNVAEFGNGSEAFVAELTTWTVSSDVPLMTLASCSIDRYYDVPFKIL